MIADDLFAGAGGWDLAAAQLGIHARGVENMKEARATRDAAGLTTIHDDVWTYQPDGNATGLIASPPCQTFSAAGKGNGRKALDDVLRGIRDNYVANLDHLRFLGEEVGDERTALVLTPLHFALTGGYEWLTWEQVPTVLPVWEACADALRAKGWTVWTGLLYAEQYGVPQTRKRAVLLAARRPVGRPAPTHSRYYSHDPAKLDAGVAKWVSMAEGLGWGLLERPSFTVTGGSSHAASGIEWGGASTRNRLLDASTDPDAWRARGWGLVDRPSPTITGGGTETGGAEPIRNSVDADGYIVWSIDAPSITVTGLARSFAWVRDKESVRLDVHEAGILQSFPAAYPWQGTKGKQFLQAGNAVPPGMALPALAVAAGIERAEAAA